MSSRPIYNNLYNIVWEIQERIQQRIQANNLDQEAQQQQSQTLAECKQIACAIDRKRLESIPINF